MWLDNFLTVLGFSGILIVMLISILVWPVGGFLQVQINDARRYNSRSQIGKHQVLFSILLWIAVTLASLVAGTTFYTLTTI